jgi:hypothetical protein
VEGCLWLQSGEGGAAGPVAIDPVGGELLRGGMGEEAFEGLGHVGEGVAFGGRDGAVVPLDAGL